MTSVRITQTPRTGLTPVNPKLTGQYEVLANLVRRRLGPDHARLFAEPAQVVGGKDAGSIVWFADGEDEAHPVEALAPEHSTRVRQQAAQLTLDLQRFADQLEREGPASRDIARLLRDALVVPDDGALWSVDGRPVLVGWGHRRMDDREAAPALAYVTAPGMVMPANSGPAPPALRPVPPPVAAVAPTARSARPFGRAWLSWIAGLLALLCLLVLGERLLRACAIGPDSWPAQIRVFLPNACPIATASAASRTAIAGLETDLRERERDLTGRALSCAVSQPVPPERRVEIPAASEPASAAPSVREAGERLDRVQRGRYLEVTLLWDGSADLDVHIGCPGGGRVAFNARSGCGGVLVADLNSNGGNGDARPIEHVIWDAEPIPTGTYSVGVNLFDRHGDTRSSIPYRIVLWRDGRQVRQEAGEATAVGTISPVLTFTSPFRP